MKRLLFASDLDNTLIFSHKHRQPGDICVEWYEGREQSFMTPRAWELLQEAASAVEFLPVTTRSIEQYQRIHLPVEPAQAITTNGGILLQNGKPDAGWLQESQALAEPHQAEIDRLSDELSKEPWCLRWKQVDGLYLFAVCEDDPTISAAAYRTRTNLTVEASGRKLYLFPPGLDKGTALTRYSLPEAAAGDSTLDIPMLCRAETAFIPYPGIPGLPGKKNIQICPKSRHFSEFVLESVIALSRNREA